MLRAAGFARLRAILLLGLTLRHVGNVRLSLWRFCRFPFRAFLLRILVRRSVCAQTETGDRNVGVALFRLAAMLEAELPHLELLFLTNQDRRVSAPADGGP